MARLIPDDIDEALALDTGHAGEWHTLRQLRDGLPDEFVVYHAVHWASVQANITVYGEIDFIVANRYGKLLAIEQKDTEVYVEDDDLRVDYDSQKSKSITVQVTRNLNALRTQFARRHGHANLSVDHLLYLPNTVVRSSLPASVDPERVVDANSAHRLCQIIESLFDASPMPTGDRIANPIEVHQFLSDRVDAVPHIGLLGKTAREFTSRISGGLATWAARFRISPFRLLVQGTAGSGKTQLALQELRQAHRLGQTALYVCYNRPLADALKHSAPDANVVVTAHELGRELGQQAGRTFDFSEPDVFTRMIGALHDLAPRLGPTFDVLVIDEAQDMQADWIESLLKLVKPEGRAILLEDPEQVLYERRTFDATSWAQLESPVNFRSPRVLVDFMNYLELTEQPIDAGGGISGFDPGWHYYEDQISLIDETEAAVRRLLDDGYAPQNIAILTYPSARHSALHAPELKGLAGLPLKRHQGYDERGNQIYAEGQLLVESVRRFKGQAADAVIITEVDFEELDQLAKRMLFVAITRARLHVVLVTSERARDALMAVMG
jgi:hypothetical protein